MVEMVKEFHWMYWFTGVIYIKVQERLIQKCQKWDHTGYKQPSADI